MKTPATAALAAALATGALAGAPLSANLTRALASRPDAAHRVALVMVDAPGARAEIGALAGDRAAVGEALRRNAALAQADLLATVSAEGVARDGRVGTSWLANTVFLDATAAEIRRLAGRADVRAVELIEELQLLPEHRVSATPKGRAEGDDAVSTWGLKATKALEARADFEVDGSGVLVGILDTGLDGSHPKLAGRVKAWKSFISDSQTEPMDDNGHGTHCAGTIGGDAMGGMEFGMAPGVEFVAGKILSGSGGGTWEGVINGMQWVVDPDGVPGSGDEPALVSNSWGGGGGSDALKAAVDGWVALGVAPIFAAGNRGPRPKTVGFPGGYLASYAVGATAVDEDVASFSSRGPVLVDGVAHVKPDISAPGEDVTSLRAGKPGQWWTISGTSMATPHVAGLAALMLHANPDLSAAELFEIIDATSIEAGAPGKDNDFGEGRIDARAAVAVAVSGGKVTGHVRGPGGAAVAGATVTVLETGGTLRIDATGAFSGSLPEGTYTLAARAFGFLPGGAEVTVTRGQTTEIGISLAAAGVGAVAGRLHHGGAPVPGTVAVVGAPLDPISTDEQGGFQLVLPQGRYTLAATAFGYEATVSPEFVVEADGAVEVVVELEALPPVLVVDDDGGFGFEGYFAAAMGETPHKLIAYEQLAGVLTAEVLTQYETVVWFTGADARHTLLGKEMVALRDYLLAGGRVFLSGQNVASELRRHPYLFGTLGARFVKPRAAVKAVDAFGYTGPIEGGDGADNQNSPDVIAPAGAGRLVATYADGTGAGVAIDHGPGKLVFLSFGLEAVATAADRAALMGAVLDSLAPSAADLAARVDAVVARPARDPATATRAARLAGALRQRVGVRLRRGELVELGSSPDRALRRLGAFARRR